MNKAIPTRRRVMPRAATVFGLFVLAVLAAMVLSGCKKVSVISVPVESCSSAKTGNTADTLQFICAAFDKNGACTMQTPLVTTNTEYIVKCEFKEWR